MADNHEDDDALCRAIELTHRYSLEDSAIPGILQALIVARAAQSIADRLDAIQDRIENL